MLNKPLKMGERAIEVSQMFNCFTMDYAPMCKELMLSHRTIQQNIMRFCVEYIKAMANDNTGCDDRNAQAVKVAQMIYHDAEDAFYEPLPLI